MWDRASFRVHCPIEKKGQSLIEFEMTSSENVKENVSKFGILLAHSQFFLLSQNVTASIYKLSIPSVHPLQGAQPLKSLAPLLTAQTL